MFDRIARQYDLMNSVMTAGLHHRWRRRAADRARLSPGDSALDVCCGTGDLTARARQTGRARTASVIGCDFSEPMLDLAREKAAGAGRARPLRVGRRPGAPLRPGRFDAVTVGFGVRNLADLDRGLARDGPGPEARRTPGDPRDHRAESAPVLDLLLALVRPDRAGPRVASPTTATPTPICAESVHAFPTRPGLAAKMDAAGLGEIRYTVLAGGIVTVHSGVRE